MGTPIRRKVLGDLIVTRLGLLDGVTVYRGEIPDVDDAGVPQPLRLTTPDGPDPSGRVAPYILFSTGGGNPVIEPSVADCNTELLWSFQTTCVAAYDADAGHLADRVHSQLFRWSPTLLGHVFGAVKPPPGFDPGSVVKDEYPGEPPRFYLPQLWRLPVTTD